MTHIIVGTAGWSVDRTDSRFAQEGSALERYASVFSGVEVNSSFYRRHREATWQRWHDAVPDTFKFAVKMPKRITHELQLIDCAAILDEFFADIAPLQNKLGPVLVQLPPKLSFEAKIAERFLDEVRQKHNSQIVIEPRHNSWGAPDAAALLLKHDISLVYADPQSPELRAAAMAQSLDYLRLHGAPQVYYSSYSSAELTELVSRLRSGSQNAWCIFDNTASGAALKNAADMLGLLSAV